MADESRATSVGTEDARAVETRKTDLGEVFGVAALVGVLTWWAPEFVLIMEGAEALGSLESVQTTDGFLVLSSLVVASVGGYFGWVFMAAAFVCVDGAMSSRLHDQSR